MEVRLWQALALALELEVGLRLWHWHCHSWQQTNRLSTMWHVEGEDVWRDNE